MTGPAICKVISEDCASLWVGAEEEPRIDAAVSRYVDSGCTQDTFLCLTTIDGMECKLLASTIRMFYIETPEHRRRRTEIEKALEDEDAETRKALGIFE